jgi:tRNA A-37 threonylcarbamoyl transferase component Bud32
MEKLREIGIDTVEPLLALVKKEKFTKSSLLVMEPEEGPTLAEVIKKEIYSDEDLAVILETVKEDLATMHKNNIAFGDPHLGNIIVKNKRRVVWCDLDGMTTGMRGRYFVRRDNTVFARQL